MYEGVACFWLEPTGRIGIKLRRFTFGTHAACSASASGHDASSGVISYAPEHVEDGNRHAPRQRSGSHRAWPKTCEACGYRFQPEDEWQTNGPPEWRRADTGELIVAAPHHLPAGSLINQDWWDFDGWSDRYGDGINLYAMCPDGALWNVDGPARSGGVVTSTEAWTRTGDPRRPETLSVTPSIMTGAYHGFLTAGRLTDG